MPFQSNESLKSEESVEEASLQENSKDEILEMFPLGLMDLLEDCSLDELVRIKKQFDNLPSDLKTFWEDRWVREKAKPEIIFSDLEEINKHRSKEGFEKVAGYHVSNKNLKEGSYLYPDQNGEIFYGENIKNLYGKYAQGWIYAVEGTSEDKVINEDFGWRTTKGKLMIVGKVPLNEDTQKQLGWNFAECEYH